MTCTLLFIFPALYSSSKRNIINRIGGKKYGLYDDERRFDFHGLGAALKRAREEKGWTQAYVAELVDRDSRTIMNIENKGQYPSFDLFVKLITMFDVSVDQFIHADGGARSSSCRKHIDVLLNSMNEKELVVIEATAEGIKKARETEVPE